MKAMALLAALTLALYGTSWAKLPAAPAPTEAQKAAADAAKAKAAEAGKKDAENLARAQDRAADNYKKGKGKAVALAASNAGSKK